MKLLMNILFLDLKIGVHDQGGEAQGRVFQKASFDKKKQLVAVCGLDPDMNRIPSSIRAKPSKF